MQDERGTDRKSVPRGWRIALLGQDLSVAGKRAGLAGERSGLFMEQIRLIKELRKKDEDDGRRGADVFPRFMVWENVPGAFSSNGGEDFRAVLEETARVADPTVSIPKYERGRWTDAGAIVGDGWSLAWREHDARWWGTPQRRRRVALLADFNGLLAPEIMFKRDPRIESRSEVQSFAESLSGDTEPGGAAREEVTGSLANRARTASAFTFRNHYDGRVVGEESLTLDTCGGGIDSPTSSKSESEDGALNSWDPQSANHADPGVMAFKLGNGGKTRSIGLEVEVSPTLNSDCGGNKPAILTVNEDGQTKN